MPKESALPSKVLSTQKPKQLSTHKMVKVQCAQATQALSKLFNKERHSDLKVVFPQSGHTLHLHKGIVCALSDFFDVCLMHDMKESSEGGIVTMSEEDDEGMMTELFRACYHFEIDIPSDKTAIVTLTQLAQKYQFNSLVPTLVSHLVDNIDVKVNVLQCLHLDLDGGDAQLLKPVKDRLEFELQRVPLEIFHGNSYLTLEINQWRYALQLTVNRENRLAACDAIHSWIAFDAENRSAYSFELLNIVKNAATKKEVYCVPSFDPQYCGTRAILSHQNRRVKRNGSPNAWNCSAMGDTPRSEFSIRLIGHCMCLMVGMAPRASSSYKKEGNNCVTCGWYLYCYNGNLYSQNSDQNRHYIGRACNRNGTVIGVKLSYTGELSFSVNGEDKGVAFRGLPNRGLYPVVDLFDSYCEVEFE